MSNLGKMAGLQPYQERMIEEQHELEGRIERLHAFVRGPQADNLERCDRDLMVIQLTHMMGYAEALRCRVQRWSPA